MYFNTSYLFESCCSNAPHCLSSSPQVAMILEERTNRRFIYFYITAHTSINITLNSYQSPLMAKKKTHTHLTEFWKAVQSSMNTSEVGVSSNLYFFLIDWSVTEKSDTYLKEKRENPLESAADLWAVCKRSKCVYDSYLLKSARRALMSPHTPRPSVNFTQRSTAAAAKPNTFWTECVSSNTQSRTSPRS